MDPDESEEVDGIVVLAGEDGYGGPAGVIADRPVKGAARLAGGPAVQAAAVAAGGFVAGAAVVGVLNLRKRPSVRAGRRRKGRPAARGRHSRGVGELVQIVGTRSLLVDIHLLDGPGSRR